MNHWTVRLRNKDHQSLTFNKWHQLALMVAVSEQVAFRCSRRQRGPAKKLQELLPIRNAQQSKYCMLISQSMFLQEYQANLGHCNFS